MIYLIFLLMIPFVLGRSVKELKPNIPSKYEDQGVKGDCDIPGYKYKKYVFSLRVRSHMWTETSSNSHLGFNGATAYQYSTSSEDYYFKNTIEVLYGSLFLDYFEPSGIFEDEKPRLNSDILLSVVPVMPNNLRFPGELYVFYAGPGGCVLARYTVSAGPKAKGSYKRVHCQLMEKHRIH